MVGWKAKILMELSTPSTVVVTSAWDSLMSMVAIGSLDISFVDIFNLCKNVSVRRVTKVKTQ